MPHGPLSLNFDCRCVYGNVYTVRRGKGENAKIKGTVSRPSEHPPVMGKKMFWCPYLVINVGCNGGLLPDTILLTLCDSIGEPFKYDVEFLSLQPMFPPKPFD